MSAVPLALLRTESELPFVGYQEGVQFQLVQANIESGYWVGCTWSTGRGERRRGSVHTLHVPASNTEVTDVWFVIHGANLNLDEAGNVESVLDAGAALEIYRAQCAAAGHAAPAVIGG